MHRLSSTFGQMLTKLSEFVMVLIALVDLDLALANWVGLVALLPRRST